MTTVHEGLEGVHVTRTKLSRVDGEKGELVYAGSDVEALAGSSSFEEVTHRLFVAAGLDVTQAGIRAEIAEGRVLAHAELPRLAPALTLENAMDALRAAVAALPPTFADSPARLVGAVGVLAAAHARGAPLAPDPTAGHAHDLLRLFGAPVDDARARALDTYLVTVADHGMNASTFTARVVASTQSDLVSAVAAAIGALKGPLHGGAPGPVLDMLDAIGAPANAVTWIEGEMAQKRRIMGMGHRVYRVRDPRAAILEKATLTLESAGIQAPRLILARAVEQAARGILAKRYPDRPLHANVEFYTAVLLDTLAIPRSHFTAVFAAARTAGWSAHVAEQRARGRLIRPEALYEPPVTP
jgi:citrate synthase